MCAESEHQPAGDTGQTAVGVGRDQLTAADGEDVGVIGLGDKTRDIEHQRAVDTGDIRFDAGQNVVQQIVVMDLRVQTLCRVASGSGGDQADAGIAIDRRFPFSEHDKTRACPVEARIHAGRDFLAAGQGQSDMGPVTHTIGFQCGKQGRADLVALRHAGEGERVRGVEQAVQMRIQFGDTAVIDAQALPDRVPALNRAVEHRDPCLIAGQQAAADMDHYPGVPGIGHRRAHGVSPARSALANSC